MPDSFFQSDKKRKRPNRTTVGMDGAGRGRGGRSGGGDRRDGPSASKSSPSFHRPAMHGKGAKPKRGPGGRRDKDEDLSSDAEGPDGRGGDLDDMDLRAGRGEEDLLSDEDALDAHETAAEKRVRMARGYLDKVRQEVEAAQAEGDYDAAEIDREIIASRLQKDVAEAEGKIHTFLGPTLSIPSHRSRHLSISSHAPTSCSLTPNHIYVSTKRGTVFRYALATLKTDGKPFGGVPPSTKGKLKGKGKGASGMNGKQAIGHDGEILCIAASEDGRYVVTGGQDKLVGVWSADGADGEVKWVAGLRGHKDAVTGIAFPPLSNPSHHILTVSLSRHLALQSLSTLSTIDTFFGHQDSITDVAAIKPTAAVTAGSRDRTCRWWKVEEEVQLVLRGGGKGVWRGDKVNEEKPADDENGADEGAGEADKTANGLLNGDGGKARNKQGKQGKGGSGGGGMEFVEGSIDCVCMLDDQHFVSGGDSGSISLWTTAKKKPIFTAHFAHGVEPTSPTGSDIPGIPVDPSNTQSCPSPRWITSLGALRGTDVFASGSWDGHLRVWAVAPNMRSFSLIGTLPMLGFINSISILSVPSKNIDMDAVGLSSAPGQGESIADADAANQEVEGDAEADIAHGGINASTSTKSSSQNVIMLAAAVSQEPRLGRWMRIKEGVRPGVEVVYLPLK